ncbi:hypothetical protein SPRG_22386 [Saprolegnia parasitica CBS 223.65]|uniref:CBM1 domain-containing protein n=1 Tax=Saprolegnia parasitica (strain CBS 223.65) TaxID=695850 RepID=A0A067BET3_SAPPC|nr:hypothetical protein SPRG_22386 [Saprolegnia parasitica CBS 223.65]KDO16894.1 hypothetical protein SPRG_22386 [Saprolegnia parasitica CBS 223.65]|eukprot:XP_012212400.1 hypothetical protein SPRG_22386 [Saprolegnia parasitica CBS 223.65]
MQYKLPAGVKCDGDSHCVLRWWYVGWNNPGIDINGQEQFWNCADIYISDTCGSDPKPSPSSQNPTPAPSSEKPTKAPVTDKPTPVTDKPTKAPTMAPKPSHKPSHKPTSKTPVHTTVKPTAKPSTKPTAKPIAGGGKKAWEQCGGKDYTGSTECVGGSICVKQDEWYSQCVPKRLR